MVKEESQDDQEMMVFSEGREIVELMECLVPQDKREMQGSVTMVLTDCPVQKERLVSREHLEITDSRVNLVYPDDREVQPLV